MRLRSVVLDGTETPAMVVPQRGVVPLRVLNPGAPTDLLGALEQVASLLADLVGGPTVGALFLASRRRARRPTRARGGGTTASRSPGCGAPKGLRAAGFDHFALRPIDAGVGAAADSIKRFLTEVPPLLGR